VKSWREAFDATWLANGESVAALDNWVRRTLADHRGLGDDLHALESVAPWSVETLARSIGAFGDDYQWLWCVTVIARRGPHTATIKGKDARTYANVPKKLG
jgi:hypothetical protein